MYQSSPRNYINSSDSAMPVIKQKEKSFEKNIIEKEDKNICEKEKNNGLGNILKNFGNIEIDDIIIVALIIMLLDENSNDYITLCLLFILLLS